MTPATMAAICDLTEAAAAALDVFSKTLRARTGGQVADVDAAAPVGSDKNPLRLPGEAAPGGNGTGNPVDDDAEVEDARVAMTYRPPGVSPYDAEIESMAADLVRLITTDGDSPAVKEHLSLTRCDTQCQRGRGFCPMVRNCHDSFSGKAQQEGEAS